MQEYYHSFFSGVAPEIFTFAAGCQYILPRSEIHARPFSFWKYIHKLFKNAGNSNFAPSWFEVVEFDEDEMNAWTFERFVPLFFNHTPPLRNIYNRAGV